MAAGEFIANYSGTSFGHTQLFRIIVLELPPRAGARVTILIADVHDHHRARAVIGDFHVVLDD